MGESYICSTHDDRTVLLGPDLVKHSVGIAKPVLSYAETTQAEQAYSPKGMIHAKPTNRTKMYVPDNYAQKPFEYYTSITDPSSKAYRLLHSGDIKYRSDGTITRNGYLMVAMGQSYGMPGDKFNIKLSSGRWLKVIIIDAKANRDTVGGWTGTNGHILEMVVWSAPQSARGQLCYGGLKSYSGTVSKIYKEN